MKSSSVRPWACTAVGRDCCWIMVDERKYDDGCGRESGAKGECEMDVGVGRGSGKRRRLYCEETRLDTPEKMESGVLAVG